MIKNMQQILTWSFIMYMVKSFAILTPTKLFIRISEFTIAYDCLYKFIFLV